MKKTLALLLLTCFFLCANSQSLPCGNGRFSDRVFTATTITTGILFGNNTTYMGVSQNLFMDIYEPTGDNAVTRPLVIFAFGGSFISGDRTQLQRLCDSTARRGYVAVTIDYRKYDNPLGISGMVANPNDAIDATAKAMSDFKAAIRYFKRDAATSNTYRIDTTSIIAAGISSGSIAALHTAYINTLAETSPPVSTVIIANGGLEGNTDLPGTPLIGTYTYSGIKAVWNMSGALFDSGYIKRGDPALFSVHGTADPVVPYGYGQLYQVGGFVSGSSALNNQSIKVGVQSRIISVQGGDHTTFYADTVIAVQINTTASEFFESVLCPTVLSVAGATLKAGIVNRQVELSWQTLNENGNKAFEVEKQLSSGWVSLGRVNSKSPTGYSSLPLNYTFNDFSPQDGYNMYRLKIISLNDETRYSQTISVLFSDKSADAFVVCPNPAGAILNFKTTLSGSGNTLKIYTSDMRLVQSSKLTSLSSVLLPGLTNGLYLGVLFDSNNRQTGSSWFIKK